MRSKNLSPRSGLLSLLLPALVLLVCPAFAGDAVNIEVVAGDDDGAVEIHRIVRHCEEGEEDCDGEMIRKIVIAGDGDHTGHPYVVRLGGEGHEILAGMHHGAGHLGFDRSFLGVQLTDLTPELRRHFGVPEDVGVMISRVVEDSPAFKAGLEVGDVITGVAGEEVSSSHELAGEIAHREEGETVDLEIWREGRVERIPATLERKQGMGLRSHRIHLGGCEEGDCGTHLLTLAECEEGEPCKVEVRCEEGSCDCTVDGEPVECEELHRGHDRD